MEKIINSNSITVSLSVVSHGQMNLVALLMQDIEAHCQGMSIELILTLNIHEDFQLDMKIFSYPVTVIKNVKPKGFGANHNQAFRSARGDYFCILNPDIRLHDCPFQPLQQLLKDDSIGVVAPWVFNPQGFMEDSARHFPTPSILLGKLFKKHWTSDYSLCNNPVNVDWVAGMFMMFSRQIFQQMNGFNERYFLYYEDVELCARLNLAHLRVMVCPTCHVIHHAQRQSHRSLTFLRWHISSLLRFLCSPQYRQLKQLHRL